MSAIWLVVKEFLTSKKFIAAVAGLLLTLLAKIQFQLPEETMQQIVAVIVAYLIGQGWADSGKEAAKVSATAELARTTNEPPQAVKDKLI